MKTSLCPLLKRDRRTFVTGEKTLSHGSLLRGDFCVVLCQMFMLLRMCPSRSWKGGARFRLSKESGCGKSTVGRSILRLVTPTNGEVLMDDKDVLKLSPQGMRAARSDMQMVFQDPFASLDPQIFVGRSGCEPAEKF